jgi:uncharacterized membrane protein (UPF0127 family)
MDVNKKLELSHGFFITVCLAFLVFAFTMVWIGYSSVNKVASYNHMSQASSVKSALSSVSFGKNIYSAETAVTEAEHVHGLSDRLSLPVNKVMLFVFDQPNTYGIWMKDMHFPLDIIWLDKDQNVVTIKENARPEDYPDVYYPDKLSLYVIEANIGFVMDNHIKTGDHVGINK